MNRNTWNQTANGAARAARASQTRADVLDMIESAEIATDDGNEGNAAEFHHAAMIAARNLRGAYDARHLIGPADLLRLAFAVRRARRVFENYADLPEDPTR